MGTPMSIWSISDAGNVVVRTGSVSNVSKLASTTGDGVEFDFPKGKLLGYRPSVRTAGYWVSLGYVRDSRL